MNRIPQIPANAPFTLEQRMWLNGYLASFLGSDDSPQESASAPKEKVVVMYASQSGNSESLAEEFGEKLAASGFSCPVVCAEDFESIDLTKEKNLLLVTSTWGDGDPPDNAVDFWEQLCSDDYPRLENLKFSVLGLGDSSYLSFCGMGKKFDARFEELGATRLSPRGDCDVDYEETANAWFDAVCKELGSGEAKTEVKTDSSVPTYSKKNPFRAKLIANQLLNDPDSPRDTRHFEFDLTGSGLTYEVGDVLGVYPKNDAALVDELIDLLGFDGESEVEGATLKEVLLCQYDVRTINVGFLEKWFALSKSGSLKSLLESEDLDSYIFGREVIDIALEHPVQFASPGEFLGLLRKLSPRLYSISSSLKAHPDQVHLTVAKVEYECHGRTRKGVCSTYLADRVNGDYTVPVFFQSAKHFKLPEDLTKPVIMVGPGTGVAPFRAFLEDRAASQASGKNWLFFGNPHETTDFFYRDQLEEWRSSGVLTTLSTAWSRDQETKIYVQDRMYENGSEIWQWLSEGAHFYVCGDAKRMAKDVDDALHKIIEEHGGHSADEAANYVSAMKKDKRYQRDVY